MNIQMPFEPATVFAVLAIFFALINLLLWIIIARKTRRGDRVDIAENGSAGDQGPELQKKLDKLFEEVIRIEDQLWGVLDKIRNMSVDNERIDKIEGLMEEIKNGLQGDRRNET